MSYQYTYPVLLFPLLTSLPRPAPLDTSHARGIGNPQISGAPETLRALDSTVTGVCGRR